MENSTGFEVRFSRTIQAAQYEPASAEIKAVFSTEFGPEGDPIGYAELKLRECRAAVERVLGLRVGLKPVNEGVGGMTATEIEEAQQSKSAPAQTEEKRRRGRPSLKEQAEKAAKRALENASNDPMAEILSEEDPTQNISTGEERNDDPMVDVLSDDPVNGDSGVASVAEEKPITDQELQNSAGKAVQRLGDANIVRKMVKQNYKVQRLDEVPPQLRRSLVNDLANLQKDGSIKLSEKK